LDHSVLLQDGKEASDDEGRCSAEGDALDLGQKWLGRSHASITGCALGTALFAKTSG
jgi:hypothetical protein